jgi:hypothetical protein
MKLSNWRQKNFGLSRGRGGRGVWGEFRRARTFRRSEAEAVSSVQNMFEQSRIIPLKHHNAMFVRSENSQLIL